MKKARAEDGAAAQKKAKKQKTREAQPVEGQEGSASSALSSSKPAVPESVPGHTIDTDPYLLAEADYLKTETKWRNKQRTLVFCSRGVSHRQRHLMSNLRELMPHHKVEAKWEKKQTVRDINEICEMKLCNNCIFLESRKGKELYMWVSRIPHGPSAKFQILNIHTMEELKMTGNCLRGSRPLLTFDKPFDELPELRLLRELFTQAFGTPRSHPKPAPFHDHVFSFLYLDGKIWFRHYQISPQTEDDRGDPKRQLLTEIGPRFVMDPIKIFEGSFGGETLYKNEDYLTPPQMRQAAASKYGSKYEARVNQVMSRQRHLKENEPTPDQLADLAVFAGDDDYDDE
uniref:Brix domain-containing protein n=1 Tax=Chromera velia CCMP2878 TaxID=1169474 RepID=A0A0G4GM05_9ALVE|mmetsp:Transcript_52887/g.103414  ORF Transcript_52887/g.103414 Transcript_52887/m.103414 type:complete len:343 (+) Transcript_52887:87-1115(+)|eukprot:Cvel_22489.t1-p1 / transcript=Cvel_22489.t1 / gene=Cvel_22489 / organism=Chromera_velia_CCMP2878 / gene_product=Ribosome biogenesis protein BRX1 homolog, putative / transcript_product=Ribosome biogenesis protein BRX1 homolog, putative / location=Cvel_scaffold2215:29382-31307(+) / protein_length=342 / sequence_SO=supercontig / SO=protein_coding / is_pseudo=false